MPHPETQFLHERNPSFHASLEVETAVDYLRAGGEAIPNQPSEKIAAYLGFLANGDYVNDGILTGDQSSIDRQIAHHVIRAKDVPEGYFELQRRIAREQGHGDVTITREMRGQMVEAVQSDQHAGLAKWVEYIGGEDGGYPDWFKHYAFGSVTKLGNYDKEKGEFLKRSKGTTAAYPELNREALAYVYDALNKSRVRHEAVDGGANNDQLQKLLKGANFGKLYAHAVLAISPASPELRKEVRGSWTKFDQTSDPRTARRLAGSLQGHGTGWCTAGESTAKSQLQGGDFYVYYTRGEDGKDTVPRVAIRMADGEVAEVRGVNAAQELEPELADITSEQLKDLPGGEAYIVKAEDMKRLTALDKKITANPETELADDELRFLYEFDHEIEGFGYGTDPRIGEIRAKRGEADSPELRHLMPEVLRQQLEASWTGAMAVIDQLNAGRTAEQQIPSIDRTVLEQLLQTKQAEWEADGTLDYLVERLVKHGERFTLLATPDALASADELATLAKSFAAGQPHEAFIHDDLYRQYSPEALSGKIATKSEQPARQGRIWRKKVGLKQANQAMASDAWPIRLSLVASKTSAELGSRPVDQQLRILSDLQTARPNLFVPSVLDAATYWYTLRAAGDKLDNSQAYKKTYIRHIDMEAKRLDGWSSAPSSYVTYVGRPSLDVSDVEHDDGARLAVG